MYYKVYTDGGARGNPWIAGCGIFITDTTWKAIERRYHALGKSTNNIAEYTAVKMGIARAIELGADTIEVLSDSELVVKQLTGEYRVKNAALKYMHDQISRMIQSWKGTIYFRHIYREENHEADRLANKAMDEYTKSTPMIHDV